MTKHSFTNFEYNVMSGPTSQTVNVVVSYLFDNKKARYVVILNQKKGANYIEEAKKVIKNKIDDGSLAKFSTKLMRRSKKPLLLGVVAAVFAVAAIALGTLAVYKYLNPGSGGGGGGGGGGSDPQEGDPVVTELDIGSGHDDIHVTADNAIIGQDYDGVIQLNDRTTSANASQYILPETLDKVTYKKGGTETEIAEYTYTVNKDDDYNSARLQIDKKYVLGPINIKLTLATTTPVVVTVAPYDTNVIGLFNGTQPLNPNDTVVVKNKSLTLNASIKIPNYRLGHDSFGFIDASHMSVQGVTWDYTFKGVGQSSPLIINNLKENCALRVVATETVTLTPGTIDTDKYQMKYKGETFSKPIAVDKGTDVSFDCTILDEEYTLKTNSFDVIGSSLFVHWTYTPTSFNTGIFTIFKVEIPYTIGIKNTEATTVTIEATHCAFPSNVVEVDETGQLCLYPETIDGGYELTNDCFVFEDPDVVHSYDKEDNVLYAYNITESCKLTVTAKEQSIRFDAYGETENCSIYSNQQMLGENPVEVELPKSANECAFAVEVDGGYILSNDCFYITYTTDEGSEITLDSENFYFEDNTLTIYNYGGYFKDIVTLNIEATARIEPSYVMASIYPSNCTVTYDLKSYTEQSLIKVYPEAENVTFEVTDIPEGAIFTEDNVTLDPKCGATMEVIPHKGDYRVELYNVTKGFSIGFFAIDTFLKLDDESLQYGTFANELSYVDLDNQVGAYHVDVEFFPKAEYQNTQFAFEATGSIGFYDYTYNASTHMLSFLANGGEVKKGAHSELHLIPPSDSPTLTVSDDSADIITLTNESGVALSPQEVDLTSYKGAEEAYFYFTFNDSDDYILMIKSPSNEGDISIEDTVSCMKATITFNEDEWAGRDLVVTTKPTIVNVTIDDDLGPDVDSFYRYDESSWAWEKLTVPGTAAFEVSNFEWEGGYIEIGITTSLGQMITEDDIAINGGNYESIEISHGFIRGAEDKNAYFIRIKNIFSDTIEITSVTSRSSLIQISTKLAADYESTCGIKIYGPTGDKLSANEQDITYDIIAAPSFSVEVEGNYSIDSLCELIYTDTDGSHTEYGDYTIQTDREGVVHKMITFYNVMDTIYESTSFTLSITPHAYESAFVGAPAHLYQSGKFSGGSSFDGYNLSVGPADVYRSEILLYINFTGRNMKWSVDINKIDVTDDCVLTPLAEWKGNYNYTLKIPNITPDATITVTINEER